MAAAAKGPDHPPHALDGLAVEGFLPHGPQQGHRQGNASQAVGSYIGHVRTDGVTNSGAPKRKRETRVIRVYFV